MIRTRRWRIALVCLVVLAAATTLASSVAAQDGPTLSEVLRETQKQSDAPGKVTLVWWLPEQFWTVSFQKGASLTKEQQESFLKAVRPYVIVAVVDGKIGPLGGADFADQETLKAKVEVIDKKGASYRPLPEEQLSNDVKNLVALLRSMFGNILGPMGQGMHLFFFPARATDGSSLADATQDGGFSVRLGEESFKWHLPLGSLLPVKVCPEDGEKMSGAWKFCPWHGKALVQSGKVSP